MLDPAVLRGCEDRREVVAGQPGAFQGAVGAGRSRLLGTQHGFHEGPCLLVEAVRCQGERAAVDPLGKQVGIGVGLPIQGLGGADAGEYEGSPLVAEQVSQIPVDSLEMPVHEELVVVLGAAEEHGSAAGTSPVGEEGVRLVPAPGHGEPHRQGKPVQLDLLEPEPGSAVEPDRVLAQRQDVESPAGDQQRKQRTHEEPLADRHQFREPQGNTNHPQFLRPEEDGKAVARPVGRPPVLDELLRGLEGGVDDGSGHAVMSQPPSGQLQKILQPNSVPCRPRSGPVGRQEQRGSSSPALFREPHQVVGGHQVHGALLQGCPVLGSGGSSG